MKLAYLYVALGLVANLVTVYCMNRTHAGWARGAGAWSGEMWLNYAGIAVPIVVTQFCLVLAKSEMSLTGAIAALISAVLIASMVMESYGSGRPASGLQWVLAGLMVLSVCAFLMAGAPGAQAPDLPTSQAAADASPSPVEAASTPSAADTIH